MIVGFTIGGTGTKPILIRGIGPTLGTFGVPQPVGDPELRLFNQANVVVSENDNWNGSAGIAAAASSVGAFALPVSSADAAMLATLSPGSYSAQISAKSGTGTALVEAYDTGSTTGESWLSNVSARSHSGAGAAVLTVGFAISGDTPKTVLIRAIGPALANFGVSGAIPNPLLKLFSGRGASLGTNDDWLAAAGWSGAFASVGAFSLGNASTRDSALLVRLEPGTYTAQASGVGGTTGVALIEVYDIPNPPAGAFIIQPVYPTGPAAPAEPSTPSANPGGTIPVVLTQARPVYPFEHRRIGLSGEAVIDFIVDTGGRVVNAYVLLATDIGFGEAGLAAVRQWTFRPGLNASGQPVPTHMQVPIIFTLDAQ